MAADGAGRRCWGRRAAAEAEQKQQNGANARRTHATELAPQHVAEPRRRKDGRCCRHCTHMRFFSGWRGREDGVKGGGGEAGRRAVSSCIQNCEHFFRTVFLLGCCCRLHGRPRWAKTQQKRSICLLEQRACKRLLRRRPRLTHVSHFLNVSRKPRSTCCTVVDCSSLRPGNPAAPLLPTAGPAQMSQK